MSSVNTSANPQGKGLSPILESLQQAENKLSIIPKNVHRIADELFTSLFILNSRFAFKPVCGQTYWMYRQENIYRLSLIAPEQWSPSRYGRYIGSCQLQPDLTWTLQLSDHALEDTDLLKEIKARRESFDSRMQQASHIDDQLPVYIESLPFYSRVLASALAHSLRLSMQKSGISGLSFTQARQLLNHRLADDGQ